MEKIEEISKRIEKVEKISILLEAIGNISRLQEDYIDFSEYEDEKGNMLSNALLTLNELRRTKAEHITLSYVIDEKITEANKIVQDILRVMYKEKKDLQIKNNMEA